VRGGLKTKAAVDLMKKHNKLVFRPLPPRGRGWGEVVIIIRITFILNTYYNTYYFFKKYVL